MTATAERIREIGLPWFDKHATRGSKEIWQWTYDPQGFPCPSYPRPAIYGAWWQTPADLHQYYRDDAAMGHPIDRHDSYDSPGFLGDTDAFATWEEAEAWLLAPSGGDA